MSIEIFVRFGLHTKKCNSQNKWKVICILWKNKRNPIKTVVFLYGIDENSFCMYHSLFLNNTMQQFHWGYSNMLYNSMMPYFCNIRIFFELFSNNSLCFCNIPIRSMVLLYDCIEKNYRLQLLLFDFKLLVHQEKHYLSDCMQDYQ